MSTRRRRALERGRILVDLLGALDGDGALEAGLGRALQRLLRATGARAGGLALHPPRGAPMLVTAARRKTDGAVTDYVRQAMAAGPPGRRRRLRVPRAVAGRREALLLRVPLAHAARSVGELLLLGSPLALAGRGLPSAAARELAEALDRVWALLGESRGGAEELATLYRTSRLITARLDLAAVLDQISRAVSTLIGSTGCGIGLLDEARTHLVHAAAHGFRSDAWAALSMPVGEGLIGRCAESGVPIRVDDVRADPRSARRDVDEQEGIRSMLCVPLERGGVTIGVISAFSTRPGAFSAHHQRVLEAFAEQAGIAIHNARLFEESVRRAREMRALLEAGRAVTASLDVARTVQVIMQQARGVLGAESCSLMALERETGELGPVASLGLPAEIGEGGRPRAGESMAGLAVRERRPVQSRDVGADGPFPSMLAAPLRVGERAMGAITVFRRDVHRFTTREEEMLLALADQAAIALEHARLYAAQEHVVAERTRELDTQKRFVEVVLEALPLGVFVLDAGLTVVRANREGARVVGCDGGARCRFTDLLPPEAVGEVTAFLQGALREPGVSVGEQELLSAGEAKVLRLSAAPLGGAAEEPAHLVVLVDDITRAKRLEQQMLLTERLTTAGRLAAGVAHELNNPLATIAGCAESLLGRLAEAPLVGLPESADFRHYLGLIEEEAYRCKEITGSLLHFVREPGSRRAPADLNTLVQKAVELLLHQSRFAGRPVAEELDSALPLVTVNEGQLRQVFLGLAANALEAMGPAGTLTVRSRRRRADVEIEFEDEGPGISDEVLPRIFDPFFTTKPPGQGTGLGLAIAQGIVADHGGRIEVVSRPGKGSLFRVVLPA